MGPRERLAQVGAAALSDAELLALVLGTGARNEPVTVLATRLLTDLDGLCRLAEEGVRELSKQTGLGCAKASRIVAAVELGRRACALPMEPGTPIRSSADVMAALGPRLSHAKTECFMVLALDAKHRLLSERTVGMGSVASCPVSPADIFRALIREGASSAIAVHNHPSGDPSPSPQDIELTDRLGRAGDLLGIHLLDHLIIGRGEHFSFVDAGLIRDQPESPRALDRGSSACFVRRPPLDGRSLP